MEEESEDPKSKRQKSEDPKSKRQKSEDPKSKRQKSEDPNYEDSKSKRQKSENPKSEDTKSKRQKSEAPKSKDQIYDDPKYEDQISEDQISEIRKSITQESEKSCSDPFEHNAQLQILEEGKNSITVIVTIDCFHEDNFFNLNGSTVEFKETSDSWLHSIPIPVIYCNGNTASNEGYVSILFKKSDICSSFFIFGEVLFTASVLNSEKNKQCTQTLYFDTLLPKTDIGFKKYIAREELLKQSSDLLSNDTLTLHIEMCWKALSLFDGTKLILDYYCYEVYFEYYAESAEFFFKLDSDLGKRLSEISNYFKNMSKLFTRKKTTTWRIYWSEFLSFLTIAHIMMGGNALIINNIDDLFSLYIAAHKYGIQPVKEICQKIFEKYMCDGNVDKILFLSQMYNDDSLKTIVKRFQGDSVYRNKQNESNLTWSFQSELQIQLKLLKQITRIAEDLTVTTE